MNEPVDTSRTPTDAERAREPESEELERLRADVDRLRHERDAYRSENDRIRADGDARGSAELQLLSVKLSKEIREDFYSSVSRMLWIGAVLIGLATFGGYLRLDQIIDGKINDQIGDKRREMEAVIESSLADFRGRADEAVKEVGERREAVRTESESVIRQLRTVAIDVSSGAGGASSSITVAAWDPWFGILPKSFVGVAGSREDQYGSEGAKGGAFTERFVQALSAPAADQNRDGGVSILEAVRYTGELLERANFDQEPVVAGPLADRIVLIDVTSRGSTSVARGRLLALLIGVADYPEAAASDLVFPVQDAQNFANLIKKGPLAQLSAAGVEILADRQATAAAVNSAIARLVDKSGPDDTLLVYFSGRVTHVPDTSGRSPTGRIKVIVPHDYSNGNLLKVPEIVEALGKSKAGRQLLIIDG